MRLLLVALFVSTFFLQTSAQLVAFPGAEGAGRFTSGGRGTTSVPTTVFEVTNLNDDNNPGSLRYALSQTAAYRTIIFRISGTIHLNSRLTIKANTTIAGQTAPGDGICIADYPVAITGDNVIVRYMRFRMGDKNQNQGMVDGSGSDDSFGNLGNKNIIIDHCTSGWSSDEALTIYRGDSLTIQWSFITEPLNYSYHFETGDVDFEEHGYGGIWGGRHASFHHNLIAHVKGRAPRFDGSRNLSPFTAGQENADFRNNVLYNWGSYNVNGGEGGNYNIVNNYYKYGPSTSTSSSGGVPIRYMVINPGKQTSSPVLPYGKYYVTGNYVDGSTAITNNNWSGAVMSGGTQADTSLSKVTTPFDLGTITMQSAQDAYALVLQYAGASYVRDTLDQRIVNDVINRTGHIIDVQGGYPHGTPYAQTVNAWPTLNSTPPPTDTDHDGMPDAWEISNSLNPNDPSDRNGIAGNGYTNLENYMNGIVGAPTITATGSLNSFNQNIPAVSAAQSYTVSGTGLTNDITITAPSNFEVSSDGGTTWHNNAAPITLPQSGGTVAPQSISVRMNAATAGSYSGDIVHASTGAATINFPLSGNAYTTTAPPGTSLVVAQDGTGDYTTVQAAINAAPTGLTSPYIIFIKNGKYYEKILVPSNKPFIQLVGESVANVILYYDDGASDPLPGGGTVGTQNSASFTISASDFSAFNITFANTYGDGTQGVAVLVNNDRAVFKNCRFLGNQDTLYIKGGGTPRHYFKDCYIDGNVDFIFGSSVALFDSCVVYPKSRTNSGSSYVTAANTPPGQTYGYVFRDCIIPDNTGATQYVLGRPWQNSTGSSPLANNKVVFLNTIMGTTIKPEGWATWDAGTNTSLIYYGEYQSKFYNGSLTDVSQRVPWSFQLNSTEAASYTMANLFGAWDPCAVGADVCTSQPKDIAISNFRATKEASNSVFDWNISWAMTNIKYELYRSATRNGTYTKIDEVTAMTDTLINFQLTDAHPAAGTSYYYYLVGSKAGFASHVTDTVEISSIPTITTGGNVQPFIQSVGTPSPSQDMTVSAENLLGDVVLTPPVNFEISSDGGTTWVVNPATVSLPQGSGTLASTTIKVRMNAPSVGSYTDSIKLETTGGDTKYVKVEGTAAIITADANKTLLLWPFTTDGNDSTGVRATGVLPSTPTFNNLYLSNGTQLPNVPAYSPQYGQAFGATANGDGSWGTGVGGPGGTLRREYYEEFTITADNGYSVTVDSFYVTGAFYNTSSNTRLAVVYSKSAFVVDSADVFTIPGGFANPASLPNQTGGPTQQYALSVAGLGGVTIQPGETLTFRLYFSCSSSSQGRYAMLKDVKMVGRTQDLSMVEGVILHWPFTTDANDSTAVRSPGAAASTPGFNNLYLSDGSSIPSYSPQYGQAFGATANGDGSWGTGSGGPGGTLRREYYEQYTVTANSGYSLRVDSLFVTAAFRNTSSNTRLGIVYSLSNFVADSADVSGTGGFNNPISLANQSAGPTNMYSVEVAPGGITLQPGQTMTFRFYFSCSSSSPGRYAMLKDVIVYGLTTNLSLTPAILQHWPFTTDGNDSTAVRSPGVTASTPTFNNLYISNGSDLPPYSPQYGQAFGASSNGDGSWGTSAGGPGGTLKREYYEQYTVTASNGYSVRVDSLFVTAAFRNTSSNTRLAIVYSLSNFVADSADVNGTGGFNNPISLANQSAGPTNEYFVEVANPGITIQPGQTITFRFYFSCSSSSVGRFAMLKDVKVKGLATPIGGTFTGLLQHWPFTTDGNDSTSVRATGVAASTPTFNNLYISNGSDLPPYSPQYGQAFGASSNGDGSWGTSAGGPGGTLKREYYEQYTVTATSGYEVTVDSLHVTAAFRNTSSNTRLAIVYSLSNFVADSADVNGTGGFNNPISLANQSAGPTNEYFVEVANPGITIQPGQTITFRFYFSCSSSSVGRFAMLKDVKAIGSVTTSSGPSSLIVTAGTPLSPFTQVIGIPSAEQSYTVAGTSLTGDITITAPADYEISDDGGATWHDNSSPIVLVQSSGDVAATTITVRLNASALGAHNGNIMHVSAGANTVNVAVNGTTVPPPVIMTTGTLNAFSHTVGTPSAAQSYTLSGTGMVYDMTITPPVNFEVSADGGTTWFTNASPLVIMPTAGAVNSTISVRMNASSAGTYSGDIANASTGATTVNVPVTGTAIPTPNITVTGSVTPFSQILGTPSAAQTYTVAGASLVGNVTITAAPDYEISANGGTTWFNSANPLTLTQAGGNVATTTISVRLNATTLGVHSGNIIHVSSGAATKNLVVTGTTIPKPGINVTQSLSTFNQALGTPSDIQTYTVAGADLTGNINITVPAHYEISADNGITWTQSGVTLARVNGVVPSTSIMVRLNAAAIGFYNGNIVHVSSNADTVKVPVNGVTTLPQQYAIFPVPASSMIFIAHPVANGPATLTLFNSSGQSIATYNAQPGTLETPVDVSQLAAGLYYIQYRFADEKVLLRFLKR